MEIMILLASSVFFLLVWFFINLGSKQLNRY